MTATRRTLSIAAGAGVALLVWLAFAAARELLPVWMRLLVSGGVLVFGPGAGLAAGLLARLPWLPRVALGLAFGVALAPLLAHALGAAGLLAAYPWLAAALAGGTLACWGAPSGRRRWPLRAAPAAVVLLALATGAVAFANRVSTAEGGVTVYGEYDTYDLTYYAAIAAELSHTVPPASPFFAGRMLNHAFYPHLLMATVHRFGGVPLLDLYFRYGWPALLALAVLACFVFVESISNTAAAAASATLLAIGSNLAYLAAWFLERPIWDDVVWSHNFQGAGAEVLFYGNWTPALVALFAALYALHAAARGHGAGWAVIAGATLATTVLSKPWMFASVIAALLLVLVVSRRDRALSRAWLLAGATSLLAGAPLLYRTLAHFDDSQVTFAPAFFPIPLVMAERIGMREWFLESAARLGLSGEWRIAAAAILAAPMFLVGSLGFRLVGLPAVWRSLRHPSQHDPIWPLLAWTAVAALVASTFIRSIPYHETTQIHQVALFVLVLFAGRSIGSWRTPASRLLVAALVAGVAAPGTFQYLHRKGTDRDRGLANAGPGELTLASVLRGTDPETTVVLHDRPNDPFLVGILSERRSVLSWAGYVRGSEARRADVEAFYRSPDAATGLAVLRAYRPTHVILHEGRGGLHPALEQQLELVVRTGQAVLYRVPAHLRRPEP